MSSESFEQEKFRPMTNENYSESMHQWQKAYYAWNSSCVNYYNMIILNSLIQQSPIRSNTRLLSVIDEFPSTDLRNARLKIASVWRRILAEIIDFILLHVFKILIVFYLAHHFEYIDRTRLSMDYIISRILSDDGLFFPIEVICIEFVYAISSVLFESFCLARYGATPGKRLLRLRVLQCDYFQIDENGDLTIEPGTVLNNGAALTRSAFKILLSTFLFPSVLVALFTTQNRQTSYDMAANAVVVELDDSELDEQVSPEEPPIDPTQLQWVPWMWFYVKQSAKKTYDVCDAAGEKLAWFFGITKPKYYAEIQEYERMDEEEREAWRQSFQDVEQTDDILDTIVTTVPPQAEHIFTVSNSRNT